jgi:hypothetical protein
MVNAGSLAGATVARQPFTGLEQTVAGAIEALLPAGAFARAARDVR